MSVRPDEVGMYDDHVDGQGPNRRQRQGAAATALRLAGASYVEIAEALSFVDAKAARALVEQTLGASTTDATRAQLRDEESARLERLLRSVWHKATTPEHAEHLPAAKVALAIIDRHSRLHGLDAPTEVIVHTPTTSEIDAWVASMTAVGMTDLRALEASVVIDVEAELDGDTDQLRPADDRR